MLRHFLNPPNWFTSASMFCGMYSILLATGVAHGEPNFYRAAWMIVFGGVFDMLDGRVARITGTSSEFGIQLDSLADVVSFGIAPAVLLYAWGLQELGWLGLAVAFFFFLCGTFRLARFNLGADGTKHAWSEGLTITMAGGIAASLVMAHAANDLGPVQHPVAIAALVCFLAILMISRLRFFSWSALRLRPTHMVPVALGLAVVLVVSLRFRWASAFLAIGALYVMAALVDNFIAILRREPGPHTEDPLGLGVQEMLDEVFDEDTGEYARADLPRERRR
ncbi:MAG: CDP-diacylglycerol--serine O-phosphatidyltransferase [Deltaproteobacteria bacterium]|nr:MAG: CDP-diacylglycerol--serine O-phosphatidyltransferase [Deltaproteobacteria bacterium]